MSYHSLQAHKDFLPPTRELFFWDFDGVLCDSVRETAKAGYLTCLRLWPELLPTSAGGTKSSFSLALDPPTELVDAFIRIRPMLTTGWEAVVMLRLLMESASLAEDPEGVANNIISKWSADACSSHLQRWADSGVVTQEQVMSTFHETRQEWIQQDEAGWIALHNTYPIPTAAFRVLHAEIPAQTYIVTTKSTEFVQVILRSWGVTSFDSARIFGLGSGPKIETIHRLVMAHEAEVTAALGHAADHVRAEGRLVPVRAHFFEDKLSTLVESAEHPLSKKIDVRFYLARWGYNTQKQVTRFLAKGDLDSRIMIHESQPELLRMLRALSVDPASLRARKVNQEGVPTPSLLREIAQKHGTPTFVYSLPRVAHNFRALRMAFDGASGGGELYRTRVLYAMKANSSPAILQTLLQHGACIDAVSPAEVRLALAVGFPPSKILFTANNITDEEMFEVANCHTEGKTSADSADEGDENAAAASDCVVFNVGSISRLEKFAAAFPGQRVCVRINPDVEAGEHAIVKTGTATCKFGIPIDSMGKVAEIAAKHQLRIVGLHQHTGSGIKDPAKLSEATGKLLAAASALHKAGQMNHLRFFDIGGGFKVPYEPAEQPLNLPQLASSVALQLRSFFKAHPELNHGALELFIEPGKFLVADAGHLLVTVNTLKERALVDANTGGHRTHRIAGTDSGFNHLIRPVLYQAYHHIENLSNHHVRGGSESEEIDDSEAVFKYDVAGNICESGDLFAVGRPLRRVREGDLLEVRNAGAYCRSMASEYNLRALPNEVVIVHENLQPEQSGKVFVEPIVKDTVSSLVRGAIGHVDSSAVVVRANITFKRPDNKELTRRFLSSYNMDN